MPPFGQYISEPVNTIVIPKGFDQGQAITSELNLMEMTEVEYTHLQDLIHSHMEAQKVPVEVQINPLSSPDCESVKSSKVCPSPYTSPERQPDASSSSSSASVSSNQGLEYSKEVKLLLYIDLSNANSLRDSAPLCKGEVPSFVMENIRFMSLLCSSMDMTGITAHSQPEESPKAEMTAAEGCAHTGNQVGLLSRVGNFSQLLDDSNHPEDIVSKNLDVSKTVESMPRSPWIIFTDAPNEEPVINMEIMLEQEGVIPKLFPQSWEHEIVQNVLEFQNTFCGKTGVRIKPSCTDDATECKKSKE
ncbi:hypothetical protein QTP86_021046 [Hemibagrus guttatus]|nr:hypothetical protein QTP86_021046 [Hemibagrus guttatus]